MEGKITKYCGSLKGTTKGGLVKAYSPTTSTRKPMSITPVFADIGCEYRTMNLENDICDLLLNILSNVIRNMMLMEQLFANLMQVTRRQRTLMVDFTNGLVHPI
jgi:hypothetical protein